MTDIEKKFAKEDTPLDTIIVARLLLQGHSCEDCTSRTLSSFFDKCFHPKTGMPVNFNELTKGRGVCSLWGKLHASK